jgi:signal transduction histidine kinase
MTGFSQQLLPDDSFMPPGMCYLWQPGGLALHVVFDSPITVAYFSISLTLAYFVYKRRDLPWIVSCIALFIVAYGWTHFLAIWVIWHAESDLRRLNEQLEQRVAERTGGLETSNRNPQQTLLTAIKDERLQALGQMAGGIAHDFSNALSPAAIYSQLLLEGGGLIDEAPGYLADTHRSVQDVAHTASRLRDLFRERDPQLLATPVQLNRILAEVIDLTRARWHDMPLELGIVVNVELNLCAALPQAPGVESEIRDALINLL